MKKTRLLSTLAVCAAMLLAGCSNGDDAPTTYTVTVTSGGNGTAVADKTAAEAGTTVNLTATPDPGYDFVGWTVVSGSVVLSSPTATPAFFTMPAGNVTVKAEFAEIPTYTVTVTSGDNGAAEADKETAAEGATVTLTATPDNGYELVRWTVESGGVTLSDPAANPATFTMPAGNVSIKAEFIEGVRINGVIWAYTNVDAPGTFAANPENPGMFYQWNRRIGWSTTDPLTSSPAGATWDSSNASGDEWEAANDPCPSGWRVPTREELAALCDAEKTTSEWTASNGVNGRWFTDNVSGNSVFFPVSRYRNNSNGTLYGLGNYGYLWSASPFSATSGYFLFLNSGGVGLANTAALATGLAVRCVAE